ncbi:tRNA (N6-threonylcarbamoyladenosine(37)-N6)-methyltransferase TrmO [Stappia sp.]|uniref:tRNA (N6-threonylcarbamoyladenosine(37)-N6)-methyltransferase TrmO n=1 Tax=Stappia sp. TaxID=1870903 RepID=UPI0032D8E443
MTDTTHSSPVKPPRPGEERLARDPAELAPDAGLVFIGHIETPWQTPDACPRNARASDATARVRLKPEYLPGLASIDSCTHVILLYWMHRARRDLIVQAPSFAKGAHGCFALRSPIRPNPVSLSVSELVERTDDGLIVRGIDCLNGTPLIDIKPYFARTDSVAGASVGWFEREDDGGS